MCSKVEEVSVVLDLVRVRIVSSEAVKRKWLTTDISLAARSTLITYKRDIGGVKSFLMGTNDVGPETKLHDSRVVAP